MTIKATREDWLGRRIAGWNLHTGKVVSAALAFLTLTGAAIFALPFSVFVQHSVLLHTLLGLAFLPFLLWYLGRHLVAYWSYPLTHLKLTGYLSAVVTLVCCVSGVVLTWEGAYGTYRSDGWRLVHLISTVAVVVFLGAHLGALFVRHRASQGSELEAELARSARRHGRVAAALFGASMVATAALTAFVRPLSFVNEFPADYDAGVDASRPFAPSLARTATGGAFDARSLSGSASCGSSGCHQEIYEEWLPSAHRYASMDPGFQAIQGVMAQQNGAPSTRYCGGCHDPISLFAGTKRLAAEDLTDSIGYHEGISCTACHAIQQTDVKGNANYVMAQPERYVWELREGKLASFLANFMIRVYPERHTEVFSRRMFKTPEFCAACHKQFIDEEVNNVGWVQLQNQYDNWRASRWNHKDQPRQTIECRECHMPLVDSQDPASGDVADFNRTKDDKKHRSHRFLGANQFVPELLHLDGADEHVKLTHDWLKGAVDVHEIAERWREGPAVPIALELPEEIDSGAALPIAVHVLNNKVGHDFPTGPLDIIQAWIEVVVTDAAGKELFHTGGIGPDHFIDTGTFMFKAEPIDRYGNLIDRHNLWEMVGVRFRRSLFPGSAETASYTLDCSGTQPDKAEPGAYDVAQQVSLPEAISGPLHVRASLMYRKFDQYLLNFAFGADSGLTAPVTEMARAEQDVRVLPRGGH